MTLLQRVLEKRARVVVMGVGYAGLPMAVEFARSGFRTTGLDPDTERVRLLNLGESYIGDVTPEELGRQVTAGRLDATSNPGVLREADVIVVCVPTPLNKTRDPDTRHIVEAMDQIAEHQHDAMLVVLESTTYPGTTSEVVVPRLTANGRELGKDVFVAFSPERVDPGNRTYKIKNTPRVISGATQACLELASALYSQVIERLVPVSSTDTAEMVKLLENTFRAVNIALVNEVAIMSRKLGVDPFEVIRGAATKPFGFMPFYPGPGLGGHCLTSDPLYLSWQLRRLKYQARFIDLADAINTAMPAHVLGRIADALNDRGRAVRGAKVLVYGVSYKRDVSDTRESPALDILAGLSDRGANVAYMDPWVPNVDERGHELKSVGPETSFADYDLVVITTDHAELPRERVLAEAPLIVDTRDALHGVKGDHSKVYGL